MEGSRFPLNLMLWIDRSHDGRDKIFAAEVFDGQPLYLGRGDCLFVTSFECFYYSECQQEADRVLRAIYLEKV